jgi:hypothetical protein
MVEKIYAEFLKTDEEKLSGLIPVFIFALFVVIVIIVQPPLMNVAVGLENNF